MPATRKRHVKGMVIIDLIKFLKHYAKSAPLGYMGPSVEKLFTTRLLGSAWYELEPFLGLLQFTDALYLKGNELRTLEFAAAGGVQNLRTVYKAYTKEGDAHGSVMAMRHAWGAMYDFAELSVEFDDAHTVQFKLAEYEGLAMSHALMTAGWGLAAARVAGCADAKVEIIDRPWRGSVSYRYQVRF